MKNEWLTTLLKQKGLSLKPADLVTLVEEISPELRNGALSYVFDWLEPFTAGMGLRISRLGDQHLELVVPTKLHNLDRSGRIHAGVIYSAGIEALRILWDRHAPFGEFRLSISKSQLECMNEVAPQEEIRLKWELTESVRETMLANLRRHGRTKGDATVSVFNDKDQLIGELNLNYEIFYTPSLESHSKS